MSLLSFNFYQKLWYPDFIYHQMAALLSRLVSKHVHVADVWKSLIRIIEWP